MLTICFVVFAHRNEKHCSSIAEAQKSMLKGEFVERFERGKLSFRGVKRRRTSTEVW